MNDKSFNSKPILAINRGAEQLLRAIVLGHAILIPLREVNGALSPSGAFPPLSPSALTPARDNALEASPF